MKLFKSGNFVCIDKEDGTSRQFLPSQNTDFNSSGSGTYYVFNTQQPTEKYTFKFDELKNEAGTLIGSESEVLIYLSENVNFKPASGGSEAGFMDYNDTTGSISLVANTWTDIPNDGLGAFTNKTYKPEGVTELLDVSTGYLDASETELGETILVRNDYQVNPNTNNALLEFRYELGNGAGIYTLEKIVGRLDSGSGQDYRFSLEPDLIYMGDTNTKESPIKLQLKLSTNGTLTNAGSAITLIKR
jgi:hypothetical protein